jgi:hypothetical protein
MIGLTRAVAGLDWSAASVSLDELNYAVTPSLLTPEQCGGIASLYEDASKFRSTVIMSRHGFGRGEYKYFAAPLPPIVQTLRRALYPHLARIANRWASVLHHAEQWPKEHDALLSLCRAAGQMRPTPLLLRYGAGDYNCLHQDLYGTVHFPLQAVVLLDRPEVDFQGGALTLVETRPRMQSRCEIAPMGQGQIAIFPVRERPRSGARGVYRTQVRHGVSSVHRGLRRTLGVIFHDAV